MRFLYILAALPVLLGLNFAANFIAQRLFPTAYSDPGGQRFAYRVVFVACFLLLVVVGGFIFENL